MNLQYHDSRTGSNSPQRVDRRASQVIGLTYQLQSVVGGDDRTSYDAMSDYLGYLSLGLQTLSHWTTMPANI